MKLKDFVKKLLVLYFSDKENSEIKIVNTKTDKPMKLKGIYLLSNDDLIIGVEEL